MYIAIEKNSRGSLDMRLAAFNKLLLNAAKTSLPKEIVNVEIQTEITHDNLLYILVKIVLPKGILTTHVNEKKVNQNIEQAAQQTLNLKPKNIAIAYSRN
ncbi:hypothetical protein ELUMI_v1c06560 [Williamsoniiplasma luminosum]|uniref:Uncharacterized protein n=1 Tax=Williamsoniiplasma luminosum TaxID=214888 RepID=A0A2K8NW04_9MOLU|nr:hypothetical protein [Williamsoniiplasma luminosum]ATZ17378.1 hypothetical protein ELUMI_v1c06560 [Williamsoniiplasma luminosum]